ncbi:MAG: type II toxin-antitoxin system VapB family antitoxin [Actinomycetota bacterium]
MGRARISTTVDERLLKMARRIRRGASDSVLVEEALAALVARNRSAEIDAAYAVYDGKPLSIEDEWGDLAAFREAAARS